MIYTPSEEKLWDCWIFPYEHKYYLFHLSLSPAQLGKGGWDGISLAISDDLIHWKEYGRVFTKDPESSWIGTGMVQQIGDTFIMNFSEEKPLGYQRIYFATSKDLIHWKRVENVVCKPDEINYMGEPKDTSNTICRWDSLGIVNPSKEDKPPYYAFLTADAMKVGRKINHAGTLGIVTSMDGLHWTCLPGGVKDTSLFPQFEVPCHVEFHKRHYVMFCTSSYLGYRFDKYSPDMSGGTFYVTSDNLLGPYRLPKGDFMLQGTRGFPTTGVVSVGRAIEVDGKVFYYHIWGTNGPEGWVGTIKLLEEKKPYELVLKYNPINEGLRGRRLDHQSFVSQLSFVKNVGVNPPALIKEGKDLSFTSLGTSAALDLQSLNGSLGGEISDLSDGRIIEADLTLTSGDGAGFYFKGKDGRRIACLFSRSRKRLEFGYLQLGWGPNMMFNGYIFQHFAFKKNNHIRILARRQFIEVYSDDIYVSSFRDETLSIDPNNLGIYLEDEDGEIKNFQVFEMK